MTEMRHNPANRCLNCNADLGEEHGEEGNGYFCNKECCWHWASVFLNDFDAVKRLIDALLYRSR